MAFGGQQMGQKGGGRRLLGYLVRPVVLGIILLVLYLWVGSLDLGSIEQRLLNREFITQRLFEHLRLTFISAGIVVVLAVTTGVLLTRPFARRITPFTVSVANIGQGVPSIGVLGLLAVLISTGFVPALIALIAYSFLPVLRNTMVGLEQVDPFVVEAGRGMGMTKTAVLFRIELPLSIPIMLAGIRTALIITVGTAALVTFTGAGALGRLIDVGISLDRDPVLLTGAILTAVVALTVDWIAGIAEDVLRPKGL